MHNEPIKPPVMGEGAPAPGSRVRQTLPRYAGTEVYHSLWLPDSWKPGSQYPVVVEYTGNWYPPTCSTGRVEDACLGYGLLTGREWIWVVLPFVDYGGMRPALTWWGDVSATVQYCKEAVMRICHLYGGDPGRIMLCGFSRGALGVNYIGLSDDEISRLWRCFVTHDHYDGVRAWPNTSWGSDLARYRREAEARLKRLDGREALVMNQGSTVEIQHYLRSKKQHGVFTFLDVIVHDIDSVGPTTWMCHEHTDRWLSYESRYRDAVMKWVDKVL